MGYPVAFIARKWYSHESAFRMWMSFDSRHWWLSMSGGSYFMIPKRACFTILIPKHEDHEGFLSASYTDKQTRAGPKSAGVAPWSRPEDLPSLPYPTVIQWPISHGYQINHEPVAVIWQSRAKLLILLWFLPSVHSFFDLNRVSEREEGGGESLPLSRVLSPSSLPDRLCSSIKRDTVNRPWEISRPHSPVYRTYYSLPYSYRTPTMLVSTNHHQVYRFGAPLSPSGGLHGSPPSSSSYAPSCSISPPQTTRYLVPVYRTPRIVCRSQ